MRRSLNNPDERARWMRMGLLTFLGLVAFLPTVHLPFQFDDHAYIETNPYLRSWGLPALKHDLLPGLQGPQEFYYRPLQTFVNRLQFSLWGLRPRGYHLTNLLFHIGNAILLTELLLLLAFPPLAVLATGALFVVHPLIVSELMMVSGLPEIMCFFFSLSALILLIRRNSHPTGSWIFYILALLSKESALAVPFFYALISRSRRKAEDRRRPWAALIAITLAYLGWRTMALGVPGISIQAQTLPAFFLQRLPVILLRYLGLALFPWHLHAYRLIPGFSPLWAYGTAALLGAAYVVGGKPSWARFCALWITISFLPKIPLLAGGEYMLEHWVYPALPAVLLPFGLLFTNGWQSSKAALQHTATAACACFLCFFIFSAQFHTLVRATDEKNYRWSLRFTRASPLLFNLGLLCLQTGRAAEAVGYMEPVYALYPDDPAIRQAMGAAYAAIGRPDIIRSAHARPESTTPSR